MSVVVIDEPLQHELQSLTAPVEMRDRQGRLLGRFSPEPSGAQVCRAADNGPDSDEELDAMRDETSSRSPAELKRDPTEELRSVFAAAGDESFEDGFASEFSTELGGVIVRHGNVAVELIADWVLEDRLPREVAAQTLRCLGELQSPETYPARRELLERSLHATSHVIRDGALIGLCWLNDPQTVSALEQALDREDHEFLRANLLKLITRLRDQAR